MIDIPVWVGIIGGILAIIAALGGAAGYYKSKRGMALIDLQDKTINEQSRRIDIVERDRDECRNQVKALTNMVTGKVAIDELTKIVDNNHKELLARLDDMKKAPAKRAQARKRK